MGLLNRIADTLHPGADGHRGPAAALSIVRWRRWVSLTNVQRDLDEVADEQAYVEAEIARSRNLAARLDSEEAAATADGCAGIAHELHEELRQTHAFLAELAEVDQALTAERNRLLGARKHLLARLVEGETPAGPNGPAPTGTSSPGPRASAPRT
jgi:hypothetical protein